jgi:hypothetical protein
MRILKKAFAFLFAAVIPTASFAQTDTTAILLPPGVPPLPDPIEGVMRGMVIGPTNASFYKEILPPEFFEGTLGKRTYIDAASKLEALPDFDQDWISGTEELFEVEKKFSKNESLIFDFPLKRGALFGSGQVVSKEWQGILDTASNLEEADLNLTASKRKERESALARKILWNTNSVFWSQGLIDFHFRMLWLNKGRSTRNVRGKYARLYPKFIDSSFGYPQLFREKLSFYYPTAIDGLGWLSFRFEDLEEDILWAYSPAIQKVRELTATNRSDSLVTSSLAIDDMLGWSNNINFFKSRVVGKSQLLAPFLSLRPLKLDGAGGCFKLSGAQGELGSFWNFENQKFKGGHDWLPAKAVFIPRELYQIELAPKDPFYLAGREKLYVDAETFLPYYKFVYDRSGRLWKAEMFGWFFSKASDGIRQIPVPGFQVIVDLIAKRDLVLDFSRFRSCREFPADILLKDFDPKNLVPSAN